MTGLCHRIGLIARLVAVGFLPAFSPLLCAEEPVKPSAHRSSGPTGQVQEQAEQPWMVAIPVPADPELEAQITDIQRALNTIDTQIVRRKEAVERVDDAATKATLYREIELLRKERNELESLLHQLVDEAKASERTEIDEALARARVLERQREREANRDELLLERRQ